MSGTLAIDSTGFRLAHAMLRVSDLDAALDFYTGKLGMRVLQQRDHKKNQFTQVYLGYAGGFDQMALELVFNWMQDEPYQRGQDFGHIAIEVKGIYGLCNRLKEAGVPMPREPRSQKHGHTTIAFIEDPDGHRIELFEPVPAENAAEPAESVAAT
ncbi:lactoylglutathione lyase [Rhodomicrobium vannielii ATCC 17100]|uniref:Aldoketomutase n=1 Tax=Rhodomicrobium vannielii (strain ATCC 17100 / DSM 162 / LMG 4299 / NCIMB 10020 / ATH 3.1.1) TaxID=648757 RepID=E3HYQ3_RHOVT|nr:VOC family protein [Rhodomicrobium vannielii]ADP69794.1 lactoylglutathione lyase [Rhodomicrobium vannielii ATCC 17100]